MEDWTCIRGAIVYRGLEDYCHPILDSLCVALTHKTGNDKSPLAMPLPTITRAIGYLLWHRHHMLTRHIISIDPTLQRVQVSLTANHIGEVAVDMSRDRYSKALANKAYKEKRIPYLLGY